MDEKEMFTRTHPTYNTAYIISGVLKFNVQVF